MTKSPVTKFWHYFLSSLLNDIQSQSSYYWMPFITFCSHYFFALITKKSYYWIKFSYKTHVTKYHSIIKSRPFIKFHPFTKFHSHLNPISISCTLFQTKTYFKLTIRYPSFQTNILLQHSYNVTIFSNYKPLYYSYNITTYIYWLHPLSNWNLPMYILCTTIVQIFPKSAKYAKT